MTDDIIILMAVVGILCLAYAFLGLLLQLWEHRYRTVGKRTTGYRFEDVRLPKGSRIEGVKITLATRNERPLRWTDEDDDA